MNSDLISVIMSIYNEKIEWLKESIDSILNQTYKNIEFIIIIDNPDYQEAIDLVAKYAKNDNRIKYFVNNQNKGLIYSLNRALKISSGKYIARMDADDISYLDRLQKQLEYLKSKNLDLIGSNINLFNENGIFYTTNKLITHNYLKKLLYFGTIGIVHPTFFGKKEIFDKLKGYNYNALHTEDKEFLVRAICNGYRVGNIKDILLNCRYNNKSITKSNAIYIDKIGRLITKNFKKCLETHKYIFGENLIKKIKVTEKEKMKFNKKQIYMTKAREALNSKSYILFIYNLIIAVFYSKSAFTSIKINLIFRSLKLIENIELKKNI